MTPYDTIIDNTVYTTPIHDPPLPLLEKASEPLATSISWHKSRGDHDCPLLSHTDLYQHTIVLVLRRHLRRRRQVMLTEQETEQTGRWRREIQQKTS